MSEEKDLTQAKLAFSDICTMLDDEGLKFDKNEESLSIQFGMKSEDLPIDVKISVSPELNIVLLHSRMPFQVKEDKRVDMAIAVSTINNMFVEGSFDFNIKTGTLLFRYTLCFDGSIITQNTYKHMLALSLAVVDKYNDKLMMLSNSIISLEQFLKFLDD